MTPRRGFALGAGASGWVWLSLAVIALDQATKYVVMRVFAEFESMEILPILDLIRLHNEGVAFSFFDGGPGWQRWIFIALNVAVSAGILIWLRRLPAKGQHLLAAALALVLAGALGNAIDRALWGHVVDFISVHYGDWTFPAFNVADSAITIGAALVILDNLIEYGRKHR
jgi:signal peptidase II